MGKRPILILQMQRMGDLILSYPLMLWLTRQYPGHPIFVAAEELFYKPLMGFSPAVTYFPWEGADVLRQHDFELVINLSIQEKAAALAGQVKSEAVFGPVLSSGGGRFVHGPWQLYRTSLVANNRYNRFHWAELNGLDVIPAEAIRATRFDEPRTQPRGVNKVGLFLGASEKAKRPPAAFWAELARELLARGLRPALFGGPAEKELGAEVRRMAQAPVLDLCGTLGLDELGAVGQTLALFVTPDTGPMHLAAWTGLKCLNLSMGPVNPWETGPHAPGHYVLRSDMDCATGCWQCHQDRLLCREPFTPKRVAGLIARIVTDDRPDKLAKMSLPDLALFRTGKGANGLYHLQRLDNAPPDEERLLSRFWQAYFNARFGLGHEDQASAAWDDLSRQFPEEAQVLLAHIPSMSRQLRHGLKTGNILDADFWKACPVQVRPLTGLAQMQLENGNYGKPAWLAVLDHLEALIRACA
ncbi:glycosyltransferase family 9 protein [Pseudodesulfovibrio sp.]|uniref:glycosyltransferase family 9 protein n=1 Tax=unclassified Pseudodesulfovibrio TaxID=2661612 RepID=UPI003B00425F